MKKKIIIFKSFAEQEKHDLDLMRKTTVMQRYLNLLRMQEFYRYLHPVTDHSRKIVIVHARPE